MLGKHVPETIDEYCSDLTKRLKGILPDDKIAEATAEARAHLQDSAEECQGAEYVGEKQAVACFVPSGKLARGLSRAWSAKYLRHPGTKWLQLFGLISSCFCVLLLLASLTFPGHVYIGRGFPLIPLVFLMAMVSCRYQLKRYIALGISAIVLGFLWGGWQFTLKAQVFASRFSASSWRDSYADSLHKKQKDVDLISKGVQFLRRESLGKNTQLENILEMEMIKGVSRAIELASENLNEAKKHRNFENIKYWNEKLESVERRKSEIVLSRGNYYSSHKLLPDDPYMLLAYLPKEMRATRGILVPILPLDEFDLYPQFESTENVSVAIERWSQLDKNAVNRARERVSTARERVSQLDAFVASSPWRFEFEAARLAGLFVAICMGMLLLADLVGGWLGGVLLRELRRRKGWNYTGLKS